MKKLLFIFIILITLSINVNAQSIQNGIYSDFEKPNVTICSTISEEELSEDDLWKFIREYNIKCRKIVIDKISIDTIIPRIYCFNEQNSCTGIIYRVYQKKIGVTTTICRDRSEQVVRKLSNGESFSVKYTDFQDKHDKIVNDYSYFFYSYDYPCYGFGIIGGINTFDILYDSRYVSYIENAYYNLKNEK
ncbi:MAG: hypothetical protein IKQ70_12755 [Bacteroidales bacterium]|nr:hypothetical protein [Bacteroidales bacterium]